MRSLSAPASPLFALLAPSRGRTAYNRSEVASRSANLFAALPTETQWIGGTPSRRPRHPDSPQWTTTLLPTTTPSPHSRSGKAPNPRRSSSARHSAPSPPTSTPRSLHNRWTSRPAPTAHTTSHPPRCRSRAPPPPQTASPRPSLPCRTPPSA